jgi:hypothetical protein
VRAWLVYGYPAVWDPVRAISGAEHRERQKERATVRRSGYLMWGDRGRGCTAWYVGVPTSHPCRDEGLVEICRVIQWGCRQLSLRGQPIVRQCTLSSGGAEGKWAHQRLLVVQRGMECSGMAADEWVSLGQPVVQRGAVGCLYSRWWWASGVCYCAAICRGPLWSAGSIVLSMSVLVMSHVKHQVTNICGVLCQGSPIICSVLIWGHQLYGACSVGGHQLYGVCSIGGHKLYKGVPISP